MQRVACYIRVSTKDQTHESQRVALNEYCQRRGLEVVEVYADTMSGTKDKRPALDKLMSDARRRKFDAVVVFRFCDEEKKPTLPSAQKFSPRRAGLQSRRIGGIDFGKAHIGEAALQHP